MTDMELAEEIERYLAPDAIYYQWMPSMADMEQIIAALRRRELSLAQTEIKGHMRVEDELEGRIAELEKALRMIIDAPGGGPAKRIAAMALDRA